MKFTIIARKIELKDKAKDYIEKKLSKLDKFFSGESETRVVVGTLKNLEYVEANVYSQGIVYRAEVSDVDVCAATDRIVDIIERQIRKNKTRLAKKLRTDSVWDERMISGEEYSGGEEKEKFEIVRTKKFTIKPMTAEEAVLQMNLLGHNFFVFKDSVTNAMNVVYKRNDGKYAIIESVE